MLAAGARYVSGRTLAGGAGAVAALLLYRALGPVDAGRLQLVLAAAMTAGTVAGLGFYESLARLVPARGPAGAGLFPTALRLNAIACVLGVALLLVLLPVAGWIPDEIRESSVLFMLYASGYAFFLTALGMLRGQGRLDPIPWLDGLAQVGGKGAALAMVAVVAGYRPALAAHTLLLLVAAALAFRLLRAGIGVPGVRVAAADARFGFLILAGMVVQMLLATLDLYLLRLFLGPEEVGLFAAGSRLPLLVEQLVLAPIGVPLLYYFSHPETRDRRGAVVERGTRLLGAALGLGALAVATLAGPIVALLLGDAWRGSVEVVRLYAGHAVGVGLLTFFAPLYVSADRPEFAILQGATTFALNLALSLALIPRFGPAGAAAAGAAAVLLTAVLAAFFVRRRFEADVRWPVLGTILLFAASFALVVAGLGALGVALFAVLLGPARLLGRRDLALLARLGRGA